MHDNLLNYHNVYCPTDVFTSPMDFITEIHGQLLFDNYDLICLLVCTLDYFYSCFSHLLLEELFTELSYIIENDQ